MKWTSAQSEVSVDTSTISTRRHCGIVVVCLALVVGGFVAGPRAVAQERQLAPSAARQIAALHAEKKSRSRAQRKIGSRLVLELRKRRGDAAVRDVPRPRASFTVERDGRVLVDVRAKVSEGLLLRIEALGGKVVSRHERYNFIRAFVPLAQLEALAESQRVRSIRPAARARTRKVNTTEGDVAHRADTARANFGVDGSGVRACVLSDSVDELSTVQAGGDLPAVNVLTGQSGNPDTSEGTATLEIVHDLAPAAELWFATYKDTKQQMAQNILALRDAGCDVIVDNVVYIDEAVFQDDVVAQAVDAATAAGALYFSAAGNDGNLNDGTAGVWEGGYVGITPPPLLAMDAISVQNFGSGANSNVITVDPPGFVTLQWTDPLGGSSNDYDLFLLNASMTEILDFSTDFQLGSEDPLELIDSGPPFDDTGNRLVVAKFEGADRFMHLNSLGGRLSFATDGQIFGHPGAVGAFAVAAVDVASAGGGAFAGGAANPVETFSSDGPRRVFFDANGAPISAVRSKPDIAAADGVATATVGFNPFFGSSASAPHAAGIAALLKQKVPSLSASGARALFNDTALDIEAPGIDRDSGAGIVDAATVVNAVIFGDGFESGDTSAWTK